MKYIALTIGPIIKTLSASKKTRELWASSYLFSYFMKQLIKKFSNRRFVIPYVNDEIMKQDKEIGLFHDRFIFEAENGDEEILKSAIDDLITDFAEKLDINKEYLSTYLQIHYGVFDVDKNAILEIMPKLDMMELRYHTAADGDDVLQKALKSQTNFLKEMIFGQGNRAFPSIPEIALSDLLQDHPRMHRFIQSDEDSVYEHKDFEEHIKPYHKYIAIVHADGDNMSGVISSLDTNEDFNGFSKALFEYCDESSDIIKDYGGETIFAGGDDLLFLAPVFNAKEDKNIFGLLDEIGVVFDRKLKSFNDKLTKKPKASLSFGLSITYYKFPLYEALNMSREQLFVNAKSGTKNNIAYHVTKHSGQSFGGIIYKGDKLLYELFVSIINRMSSIENSDAFLHSLHHKIDAYQKLVIIAAKHTDRSRLENFFVNLFDKDHRQYREFFDAMIPYIHQLFVGNSTPDDDNLSLRTLYGTLRFVKFLQGDKS